MGSQHEDEVAELRRRIYGPTKELDGDASATARLAALEGRQGRAPVSAKELGPDSEHVSEPSSATQRDIPWRRSSVAMWVGTIVLAVVGSATATTWVLREQGTTVAVLPLTASADLPSERVTAPGTVTAAQFHGLKVLHLPSDSTRVELIDDCLSIVRGGGDDATPDAYGCGAGRATARVPMNVTADLPVELREVFPVGTTLVFTLDDESVEVRAIGP